MTNEIQITYGEILGILDALRSTPFQKLFSEPIPIKLALSLKEIGKFIENQVSNYNASRQEIVDEFADRDENGNIIYTDESKSFIKIKDLDEFQNKINKLETTPRKLSVPIISNRVISDLSDSGLSVLSVFHLSILDKFID